MKHTDAGPAASRYNDASAAAWPVPVDDPTRLLAPRPKVPTRWAAVKQTVTYHRLLIDSHLSWSAPLMKGVVIDLGGKRERKRGGFRPPVHAGGRWIYANIDPTTAPDLLCDVAAVALADECADCILCSEVLEHLPAPAECVGEAFRLLRPGGFALASVPFLYPVHPDPYDYQRFTADGLRRLFRAFSLVDVRPLAGYLGTLGLLVEFGARSIQTDRVGGVVLRRLVQIVGRRLAWLDVRHQGCDRCESSTVTSGYFVIARK